VGQVNNCLCFSINECETEIVLIPIAVVGLCMAVNFGYLIISLLMSLQLHGGGLFDVFCACFLARIVIFCCCLMNLCLSLSTFVREQLVLFCLKSKSKVVRSVASFSVLFGRHE